MYKILQEDEDYTLAKVKKIKIKWTTARGDNKCISMMMREGFLPVIMWRETEVG